MDRTRNPTDRSFARSLALLLGAAAFASPSLAQPDPEPIPLVAGQPVSRELAGGGGYRFGLDLDAGDRVRCTIAQQGIDVVTIVSGPDGPFAILDDSSDPGGREEIEFDAPSAGAYALDVSPVHENAAPGSFEIRLEERVGKTERDAENAVVGSWIAEHLAPLATVEAGRGFEDLEPFRAFVGGARMVALGDATQGTRELQRLKHRLLEFLVSEMGFTAFAIEAALPESFDVDRWVRGDEGDGERALAALYFWPTATEEVSDLLHWMRAWNLDPAHPRKIRFYGIDMQQATRAAKLALAALGEVDAAAAAALAPRLARLTDGLEDPNPARLAAAEREALAAVAAELEAALGARRAEIVARRGEDEAERALRSAKVVAQRLGLAGGAAGAAHRERALAENAIWALEREGKGGKVVLWAHNNRLAKRSDAPFPSVGKLLAERLGADLRVVGFAFGEGAFQARGGSPLGLTTFNVDPLPAGTFDAMLARSGREIGFLDLADLPADGPVRAWFDRPQATRSIGTVFAPDLPRLEPTPIRESYDAVAFVRRTAAARPLASGIRRSPTLRAAAFNFDFEAGTAAPDGWASAPLNATLGYRVGSGAGRAPGGRSLCVYGEEPGRYGEGAGSAEQWVDARPWAGRRIRLSAAVRTEGGIAADVTLRPDTMLPQRAVASDEAGASAAWKTRAVEVALPPATEYLTITLAASGPGTACFDDLAIDALEGGPAGGG